MDWGGSRLTRARQDLTGFGDDIHRGARVTCHIRVENLSGLGDERARGYDTRDLTPNFCAKRATS